MLITIKDMDEEARYNNRQIERMLDSQSQDLKKHMEDTIAPLLAQVTKTNGRVTTLEFKRASQEGFMKAMAVAGGIGFTVLMALFGWSLYTTSNIPHTVHVQLQNAFTEQLPSAIQQALIPYGLKQINN